MVNDRRITFHERTLTIDNKITIGFDGNINEAVEFPESILVRLRYEDFKSIFNVFAVDYNGNRLWQVGTFGDSLMKFPFTGIFRTPDGYARLFNFDSFVRTVDPDTGELIKTEFVK